MKKVIGLVLLAGVALFLLIQLVPYGRNHTNPPVVQDAPWASAETRDIARRACYDCHSNETVWPWYTNIAPFSWLIQHDVEDGREHLNFSEWGRGEQELDEIAEMLQEGEMPPMQYMPMHPEARLTAAEQQALINGLSAMGITGGESGEEDDD